jgi:hypothetical protein
VSEPPRILGDVEAVTWTALGILAAFSLGVLALQVTQGGRFDSVNARIDGLGDRIDGLGDRLDLTAEALRAEMRDQDGQTREELRREIRTLGDRLERRLEEHEARH